MVRVAPGARPGIAMIGRIAVALGGAVQGVGFRPFVYRLARDLDLSGWVRNDPAGVRLEIEGERGCLEAFLERLRAERPPQSTIDWLEWHPLPPGGTRGFDIRSSAVAGERRATVLPDLATCPECRRELFDPADRRFRYPFLNCTRCGPRWSIIESLPYDRARTAMKGFPLCARCRAEFEDPGDRRFHAQPTACPDCGPRLLLTAPDGEPLATGDEALLAAARALRAGRIVAMKGLGGFHLMVDAANDPAVRSLRSRKGRVAKPFALMVADVEAARRIAHVDDAEAALLSGVEAPIVLLDARAEHRLAPTVAPDNPRFGVMLPATPLHHLLLADLRGPLVATSGNLAEEPLCTDDDEARHRLSGVADLVLGHDRPIVRPVDDSVARVLLGRPQILRRARGYAPLPVVTLPDGPPVLALGGQQKNSVALALGERILLGPHVGDLEGERALRAFRRLASDLPALYDTTPDVVAVDLHPDYVTSHEVGRFGKPRIGVQHHEAHLAAVLAEHGVAGPALGVVWDGTGYGSDGTIRGGEFFRVRDGGMQRIAHLRPFRLPGGDAAARDARRSAFGLLHELLAGSPEPRPDVAEACGLEPRAAAVLATLCASGLNAPWTTSMGRLFDAVAVLLGLRFRSRFEGEAAMAVEFAAAAAPDVPPFPFGWRPAAPGAEPVPLDWGPALRALLAARAAGESSAVLAARFHATLVAMIAAVADSEGAPIILVSGGCFQNRRLMEMLARRAAADGRRLLWPERVPPNDGGLAVGQAVLARRRLAGG